MQTAPATIRIVPGRDRPRQTAQQHSPPATKFGCDQFVGTSPRMQAVYDQIGRVAPTGTTVLLLGNSGTGKELAARALHNLGAHPLGPFVALNCSAMSPRLGESELFGREQPSLADKEPRQRGLFERALNGTLFLDGITEMPMELQSRILRFIEAATGQVRIVAATNRSPDAAIKQGRLREDLFYRLNVFHITLPRLVERLDDVPVLAEYFLAQFATADGRTSRITPDAMDVLTSYSWPGNVRELKNVVQAAYIMAGAEISAGCLPPEIRAAAIASEPPGAVSIAVGMTAAEAERRLILATLAHCSDCKWKAAETLGISLKTLYNRLQKYAGET